MKETATFVLISCGKLLVANNKEWLNLVQTDFINAKCGTFTYGKPIRCSLCLFIISIDEYLVHTNTNGLINWRKVCVCSGDDKVAREREFGVNINEYL